MRWNFHIKADINTSAPSSKGHCCGMWTWCVFSSTSHSESALIIAGGLACAIACRREGIDVLLLEKADNLSEVKTVLAHCAPKLLCRSLMIQDRGGYTIPSVFFRHNLNADKDLMMRTAKRKSNHVTLGPYGQAICCWLCCKGSEHGTSMVRWKAVDFTTRKELGKYAQLTHGIEAQTAVINRQSQNLAIHGSEFECRGQMREMNKSPLTVVYRLVLCIEQTINEY